MQKVWLAAKLVVLSAGTLWFRHINAALDGESPYTTVNFILLALIWLSAFLPEAWLKTIPGHIVSYGFLAAVPAAHLVLVELLMPRTREIAPGMLHLNIIFYYLAFLLLLFLFRRCSPGAVLLSTVLACVCGTVNCVVWEYRSLPVLPWDLYSASTALSVAGEYEFPFTHIFYTIQLTFVTIAILGFRLRMRHHIPHPAIHWPLTAVIAAVLGTFIFDLQSDLLFYKHGGYAYLFTPTVYYERNGAAVGFLSTLHYLNVERPDGYNAGSLANAAAPLTENAANEKEAFLSGNGVRPNVIVIMNEAFSDLRALCDYETNLPVTPNIDALTENTIRGNLHVSIKGGNTANSEYEFLTGGSMAFLPAGSIPYQQHIKGETPNLASYFSSLGYQTEAIHPYNASGWNRDRVYPWFSFDDDTFLEDFRPLYSSDLLRNFVSDEALFERIIKRYGENGNEEDGAPRFTFAVTMQNHGAYDSEHANFKPDVTVVGIEEYKRISSYLSLIRKSDEYFGALIDYFRTYDEPTIILMFGDHQPNDNVVSKLMGNAGVDNSAAALDGTNRYITPYVLWANYDIDEDAVSDVMHTEDIGIGYLSTLLCTAAELPLTGYQQFLQSIQPDWPVVTAKTILDGKTGTYYTAEDLKTLTAGGAHPLTQYQAYAYNLIFDQKKRLVGFFD